MNKYGWTLGDIGTIVKSDREEEKIWSLVKFTRDDGTRCPLFTYDLAEDILGAGDVQYDSVRDFLYLYYEQLVKVEISSLEELEMMCMLYPEANKSFRDYYHGKK